MTWVEISRMVGIAQRNPARQQQLADGVAGTFHHEDDAGADERRDDDKRPDEVARIVESGTHSPDGHREINRRNHREQRPQQGASHPVILTVNGRRVHMATGVEGRPKLKPAPLPNGGGHGSGAAVDP